MTITPRGQELVQISLPVVRETEAAWRTHLGEERTVALRDALAALREITDSYQ